MRGVALMLAAGGALAVFAIARVATSPNELDRSPRHTVTQGTVLLEAIFPTLEHSGIWLWVPFRREIWIAPDGAGRIAESYGELQFPSPGEHEEWLDAGRPGPPPPTVDDFPPGGLVYWKLGDVPGDPSELARRLQNPPASGGEILTRVAELMTETVPDERVGSVVTEALTLVPSVEVDVRGNVAVATALDDDPWKTHLELRINLVSGHLEQDHRVATEPIDGLGGISGRILRLDQRLVLAERLPGWQPSGDSS